MSYINPIHAYGFFSHDEKDINRDVDFETQITNLINFAFDFDESTLEQEENGELFFIKNQFIDYFNHSLDDPQIFQTLKKNQKRLILMKKLNPFSDPFLTAKKYLPKPIVYLPDITQTAKYILNCCSICINKNDIQEQTKFVPDLAVEIITFSPQFSCYINKLSMFCLFVFKISDLRLSKFDIFLLKCVEYALAYRGYTFIIISNTTKYVIDLIDTGFVAEMHIFGDSKIPQFDKDLSQFNTFICYYLEKYDSISTDKENKKGEESNNNLNYIQLVPLTGTFNDIFDGVTTEMMKLESHEKLINKNLFFVPNLPLYINNDPLRDSVPFVQSRKTFYTSDIKTFNRWNNGRYGIGNLYADFEEVHNLNISYFLKNQIYTAKVETSLIQSIVNLTNRSLPSNLDMKQLISQFLKIFKDKKTFKKNPQESIANALLYWKEIVYRKTQHPKHFTESPIKMRSPQLLSIFHSVYNIIKTLDSKTSKERGKIYQIDTGEGKTIIVLSITVFLALCGYKVHIITHSIPLAYRDFLEDLPYYECCKLQADILYHKEEQKNLTDKDQKPRYKDKEFLDPLDLNSDVLLSSNIVYSTAFNLEASYLTYSEKHTSSKLLDNTICLIDEADSMLLDDLYNGTTISKPILSDVEGAVTQIYSIAEETNGKDMAFRRKELLKRMQHNYPAMSHADLDSIIRDADHVRDDMVLNLHYFIQEKQSFKDPKETSLQIIPYDYKKGSLEDNKQFSGFVHQLIAVKENIRIDKESFGRDRSNLKFVEMEPLSVNYLYIGHPSYLKHYMAICGFTGTIGTKKDEALYKNLYSISALRIPRNQPNYRYDMPPTLVDTIEERNKIILEEVKKMAYHNKSNKTLKRSILIILEDPNEFKALLDVLTSKEYDQIIDLQVRTGIPEIDIPYQGKLEESIALLEFAKMKINEARRFLDSKNSTQIMIAVSDLIQVATNIQTATELMKGIRSRPGKGDRELYLILLYSEVIALFQEFFDYLESIYSSLTQYFTNDNGFDLERLQYVKSFITSDTSFTNKILEEENKPIDVIIAGNNYGRGTNADKEVRNGDHLHVIIGYFSPNMRSIYQALGRTGRSGRSGTTRIVCLRERYFSAMRENNLENIDEKDVDIENQMVDPIQIGLNRIIKKLEDTGHKWIFDDHLIDKNVYKKLSSEFYGKIRNYTVNVSRMTAVNYEFPFGFDMYYFFTIQAQRIYSLINCPNCVYTWQLIARYFREMVLEGWTLFIDSEIKKELTKLKEQRKISSSLNDPSLEMEATLVVNQNINKVLDSFYEELNRYLPLDKERIDECFLHLTDLVNYENKRYLKNSEYQKAFWALGGSKQCFISVKFGAFPFTSLLEEKGNSGIKFIPTMPIQDPELKYDKFSITKYLDAAFDMIIGAINGFLSKKCGLQLYLKRTVAGTEFGLCFQPFVSEKKRPFMTLHDIDLTFIAAINVKSEKILLISIMILLAAVLAACFSMIEAIVLKLFKTGVKELLAKLFDEVIDLVSSSFLTTIVNVICAFIVLKIQNIMKERFSNSWVQTILKLFVAVDFSSSMQSRFKGKGKFIAYGIKIGICVVMLFAAFFSTFSSQPKIKNDSKKQSSDNQKDNGEDEEEVVHQVTVNESSIQRFQNESKNAQLAMNKATYELDCNGNEQMQNSSNVLADQIKQSQVEADSYEYGSSDQTSFEIEMEKVKNGTKSLSDFINDDNPNPIQEKKRSRSVNTKMFK